MFLARSLRPRYEGNKRTGFSSVQQPCPTVSEDLISLFYNQPLSHYHMHTSYTNYTLITLCLCSCLHVCVAVKHKFIHRPARADVSSFKLRLFDYSIMVFMGRARTHKFRFVFLVRVLLFRSFRFLQSSLFRLRTVKLKKRTTKIFSSSFWSFVF